MKQIGVGVLGFGTVGAGVADGLLRHRDVMARRLGVDIVLRRIADLDITTDRGVSVPGGVLTTDAASVIADPEVQIVVETIGGTGVARKFVMDALNAKKCVVTANKKLLAEYGREIFDAAAANGVDIYFGASVGGGIPIIRVLREGLAGNEIKSIHGILNGTCNYILTRMENEGLPFDEVLKDAQRLGYAEADPTLDIDGFDTAHKACILTALAYGFQPTLDQVKVEGIRNLSGTDVKYAADFGYRIKLLAVVARDGDEVEVGVHPTLIPFSHMLANVNDAFNAAMVNGDMSDYTMYYGRGAGRQPTASTVVGDIVSKSYVRFMVADRPGAFGTIASILGKHGVSISAATQKESNETGFVPVVALMHKARASSLDAALAEIRSTGVVSEDPIRLRMI